MSENGGVIGGNHHRAAARQTEQQRRLMHALVDPLNGDGLGTGLAC